MSDRTLPNSLGVGGWDLYNGDYYEILLVLIWGVILFECCVSSLHLYTVLSGRVGHFSDLSSFDSFVGCDGGDDFLRFDGILV